MKSLGKSLKGCRKTRLTLNFRASTHLLLKLFSFSYVLTFSKFDLSLTSRSLQSADFGSKKKNTVKGADFLADQDIVEFLSSKHLKKLSQQIIGMQRISQVVTAL